MRAAGLTGGVRAAGDDGVRAVVRRPGAPRHAPPARHPRRRRRHRCWSRSPASAPGSTTTAAPPSRWASPPLPHAAARRLRPLPLPDAGEGPGRLQFLLGCVAVLVASVLLVALPPSGDAPFVAAAFPAAVGTLATFAAILTDAARREIAAVSAAGRRRRGRLPARPVRPLRPAAHRLRAARPARRAATTPTPSGPRDRGPSTSAGSPPRPAAATSCCSAWSAAAPPWSSAPPARPRLLRHACGPSCSRWPPASRSCSAPGSSATPRRSPACSSPASSAIALLVLGLALNPPVGHRRATCAAGDRAAARHPHRLVLRSIAAGRAPWSRRRADRPAQGRHPLLGPPPRHLRGLVLLSLVPLCLAVLDVYGRVRGLHELTAARAPARRSVTAAPRGRPG